MGGVSRPAIALDDASDLHLRGSRRPTTLLRSFDVGCRPRRSSSYHRLPQQLLKLTVVKLDGSSFEVQISKLASVSDLKLAVEQLFKQPSKDCHGEISWSHVWGHFCLCYHGIKLVNDKCLLRAFGIKDGDQLYFIRHHYSLNHYKLTERSPQTNQVNQHRSLTLEMDNGNGSGHQENTQENHLPAQTEIHWVHLLRGWLSCTKLWRMGNRSQERSCTS